jgi:glycosyltransferase involved in cell wall biosynthesis
LDDGDSFDGVPHRVIASPTFAASYWNLNPKSFAASPRGYEVGGQPLRSFDFRGYDSAKPHLLSKYQGVEPRILLSEWNAVGALCDEYREKLTDADLVATKFHGHDFDVLSSGLRIDERMLQIYQDALAEFKHGKSPEPPSPFGPEGEQGFLGWLNGPAGGTENGVTRYMMAVREDREDVKAAFPDPVGAEAKAFREWYLRFGRDELDLPAAVVPARKNPKVEAADQGMAAVNVAGYFRAELGLGVAARAILSALESVAIPFNTVSFGATANRQNHPFEDRQTNVPADVNLVCVNPDQLETFAEQTGPALRQGRYTVGVWFWEVEDFPKSFHGAFNYVDEIWVATEFMRETFRKVSPKPVFKYVLPIEPPEIDRSLSRADLGLPNQFTFLFSFDLLSVLERKNPLGLIRAFTEAFPEGSGPALVIKTINGEKRRLEMEKLRYFARGRSDIIVIDGYLSSVQNSTLTALADCYVSLHRSEGFGLTIAEAMALGKPAMATAYSGNLEFMANENSYLCPYRLCPVGRDREPYPATSQWAEPDTEAAARILREVYANREAAELRGRRAAENIRALQSPGLAGEIIRRRLETIQKRRQNDPPRTAEYLKDIIEELQAENATLRSQSKPAGE